MNSNRVVLLAAALVAVLAPVLVASVTPGQPAPDLRLPAADGQTVVLANHKGKVVLVDFWASWCGPCRQSFPAIDVMYRDLHARGFEVIAVNLDQRRSDADRFLADRPHSFTVVFDPDGTTPRAFGLYGMPTSFLVGRDGRVRYVHMGYSEKVIKDYRHEIEQLLSETP